MSADVPSRWKHSFVTPIPNRAPRHLVSNYSIRSVFARVFERTLKTTPTSVSESNSILPSINTSFGRANLLKR